jgi:hypothetical protein
MTWEYSGTKSGAQQVPPAELLTLPGGSATRSVLWKAIHAKRRRIKHIDN